MIGRLVPRTWRSRTTSTARSCRAIPPSGRLPGRSAERPLDDGPAGRRRLGRPGPGDRRARSDPGARPWSSTAARDHLVPTASSEVFNGRPGVERRVYRRSCPRDRSTSPKVPRSSRDVADLDPGHLPPPAPVSVVSRARRAAGPGPVRGPRRPTSAGYGAAADRLGQADGLGLRPAGPGRRSRSSRPATARRRLGRRRRRGPERRPRPTQARAAGGSRARMPSIVAGQSSGIAVAKPGRSTVLEEVAGEDRPTRRARG